MTRRLTPGESARLVEARREQVLKISQQAGIRPSDGYRTVRLDDVDILMTPEGCPVLGFWVVDVGDARVRLYSGRVRPGAVA